IFSSIFPGVRLPAALLALLLLAGCTGLPGSAPTRFYILKPASDLTAGRTIALAEGVSVGVGPVQIPGYADRAQIVTFGARSEIAVHDLGDWAEPLSEPIRRVLASNVAELLGPARAYPYPADFRPDRGAVQVAINVIDITQLADGQAKLSVRW